MASTSSKSPQDVAEWVVARLKAEGGVLSQEDAAVRIERRFGAAFVRENDQGGMSIQRSVLAAFRVLTEDTVVWDRTERSWRLREKQDPPARLAD